MSDERKQLNFLEKHRQKGKPFAGHVTELVKSDAPATPAEDVAGVDQYRAFYVDPNGSRQLRLDVRMKDGSGLLIPYGHILPVRYDGEELVSLLCTGLAVTIEGKRLRPVIEALQRENALYLREWDGHQERADEGGPVIERITLQQEG